MQLTQWTTGRLARAVLAAGVLGAAAMAACRSGGVTRMESSGAVASRDEMLRDWPMASREAARMMTAKYGQPDEATPSMLAWHDKGPWKHIIVSRQETQHDFPAPHADVMEQVVDYRVPPEMFDDLAMYDGSVIAERTKGELSARCDKEGANFLALNLAHEIVTGRRSVDDARQMYAEEIMKMKAGKMTAYTSGLMFGRMARTMDPDRPR